ncbi:MAG: hypothetical protein ACYC4S_02135 [Rhodoferax sp.]
MIGGSDHTRGIRPLAKDPHTDTPAEAQNAGDESGTRRQLWSGFRVFSAPSHGGVFLGSFIAVAA